MSLVACILPSILRYQSFRNSQVIVFYFSNPNRYIERSSKRTTLSLYLGSLIVIVVGAAMRPSLLLQRREILDEAGLGVLSDPADRAMFISPSEEHCATQVYSTGPTTIY